MWKNPTSSSNPHHKRLNARDQAALKPAVGCGSTSVLNQLPRAQGSPGSRTVDNPDSEGDENQPSQEGPEDGRSFHQGMSPNDVFTFNSKTTRPSPPCDSKCCPIPGCQNKDLADAIMRGRKGIFLSNSKSLRRTMTITQLPHLKISIGGGSADASNVRMEMGPQDGRRLSRMARHTI